jgi:NADH:ubiquinone oxidoreductase subunit 4 (subunit M)
MFFWTQFGAIFLIFVVQYMFMVNSCFYFSDAVNLNISNIESYMIFTSLLVGFGVKFPIWPFYDWLPQAHVEASTNFSIFLSGVLVKFAFFGFIKFMVACGFDAIPLWFYPFILVGFLDASTKLYYQSDLKKIVAYSTVIEMHWLTIAIVNGTNLFWLGASAMLISHALLSSNFFFFVDSITRRYKTRLLSEVSGLFYSTPNLYFVTLVTLVLFLGFPGTLFFIAEVFFFSALLDFNFLLFFLFFFFAYFVVPSCFFKSWFLALFGSSNLTSTHNVTDLARFELVVVWVFIFFLIWFGLISQSILI